MKFDALPVEDDEPTPLPSTASDAAESESGDGHGLLPPGVRLQRAFEYAHVRSGLDLGRVHGALNRMHHTIEVAHAKEAAPAAPTDPLPDDVFRPEAFQARVSP